MKDIHIFIKKNHSVDFEDGYAGLNRENLQGNIIFDFEEFVSGQARIEVIIDNEKGYIELERVGQTYTLPIKSSLLSGNDIVMQLVITQEAIGEEIPIWKSESFLLKVGYSINAEAPIPEEYPSWIEIISSLVAETDNAIERAGNLNIEATQTSAGATITITNQDDEQTSVVILNGEPGTTNYTELTDKPSINGVELTGNKTTSQLGINIPIVNDATLTIQKNGTNVQTFTANSSTNKTANIEVPTKVSELSNDEGYTSNVGTITGIKMNGSSKGTSGVVDLGTVITDVSNKQDTLVSGTNIKTINNQTLLGSGNIDIQGGGGTATDVQINGTSITSSGIANIRTKSAYNSSTNKIATESDIPTIPTLSTVATSGSYNDLLDKPTIPPTMTILSYGNSTWNDFITAYTSNSIVYCKASSNANPGTGDQSRLAFMAYVNNPTTPTSVEFQYYRSVSSHSASQQTDQVFVYKLTNASGGTWTVETREAGTKIATGTGMSSSYNNGTITLSADLTGYVQNTDYATQSSTGVIKASANYQTNTTNTGELYAVVKTYNDYSGMWTNAFISKGTLDNVITGKGLLDSTKVKTTTSTTAGEVYDCTYINTMLGNIETLLSEV